MRQTDKSASPSEFHRQKITKYQLDTGFLAYEDIIGALREIIYVWY